MRNLFFAAQWLVGRLVSCRHVSRLLAYVSEWKEAVEVVSSSRERYLIKIIDLYLSTFNLVISFILSSFFLYLILSCLVLSKLSTHKSTNAPRP